ncbi:DUF6542 domain-containing protein [Nocardioides insulae]|uniref:DUF6542 domain-containing protein n=1 Tax=Nocardioides insulae TaxID=394734 RepID=UPI00042898F0|nr:DUF6542 domain-containing protein [Nocardioides insulae]
MAHARTIWEEGRESGSQVVALGLAVSFSAAGADLLLYDRIGLIFDVVFVLLCVALALLVAPQALFTVGVLPPLLMLATFTLLGFTRPDAIAHPDDGVVQAVVSGLGTHSVALFVGYALCLACLAMRRRVAEQRARLTD